MKTLLVCVLVLLSGLVLSSCGSTQIPCDQIATLTQEGALYLCNVLSHQAAPASSLSVSERAQAIASINALQGVIAGYRTAALAQGQVYAAAGDLDRARKILDAAAELARRSDTLRSLVKAYGGK